MVNFAVGRRANGWRSPDLDVGKPSRVAMREEAWTWDRDPNHVLTEEGNSTGCVVLNHIDGIL